MKATFFLSGVTLLKTVIIQKNQAFFASGFEFDHDIDAELCTNDVIGDPAICTANSTMWYSCPISCAEALHGGRGTMAEERSDPDQFFALHARRIPSTRGASNRNDKIISLEDNEGYVTMYAILPMLPGMAEYYYDAIDHIAQVYKYTLVAMILPYYDTTIEQDDSKPSSSKSILDSIVQSREIAATMPKSIMLEGYDVQRNPENEILEYLLTREVVAGTLDPQSQYSRSGKDNELLLTRPNIFLVSHTGMFIEHVVSPTMEMIERRIKVHELAMEENLEL